MTPTPPPYDHATLRDTAMSFDPNVYGYVKYMEPPAPEDPRLAVKRRRQARQDRAVNAVKGVGYLLARVFHPHHIFAFLFVCFFEGILILLVSAMVKDKPDKVWVVTCPEEDPYTVDWIYTDMGRLSHSSWDKDGNRFDTHLSSQCTVQETMEDKL